MKLLEPGKIGKLEIKNRIVMAAMGVRGLCEPDGNWGERFREYYAARARGNVDAGVGQHAVAISEDGCRCQQDRDRKSDGHAPASQDTSLHYPPFTGPNPDQIRSSRASG